MEKRKVDVIQRGTGARTVLDSKAFQNALEDVREKIMESWRRTTLQQAEERELLFFQMHGLDLLEGQLRNHVRGETVERKRIEMEAEREGARIVPV
jgi:hypothetical protein